MPPPNTNYRLFVEYDEQGTKRTDIFQEALLKHQSNRFRGYGPLVLALTNSIHYFEKNTTLQKALNGPVKEDLYFKMLRKTACNYLSATRGKKLELRKITLVVCDIHSGSSKVYFD